jgi:hypothetical protein
MCTIRINAKPDEMQDTVQGLQISFRSGGMAHYVLINKSMGFSQSLSRVPAGGDIVWQKPNVSQFQIY